MDFDLRILFRFYDIRNLKYKNEDMMVLWLPKMVP